MSPPGVRRLSKVSACMDGEVVSPPRSGKEAQRRAPWGGTRLREVPDDRSLHELGGLLLQVVEPAAHEEGLLGEVVVLALADLLERLDRLLERDGRAGNA